VRALLLLTLTLLSTQRFAFTGLLFLGILIGGTKAARADGFLDAGGVFTTIDNPSAIPRGNTAAVGINDRGQIVGSFHVSIGYHSFVDAGGVFTTFDDPSAIPGSTHASGINDRGPDRGKFRRQHRAPWLRGHGGNLHTEKLSLIAQSPLLRFGYAAQ
jgi:hypothetical protein